MENTIRLYDENPYQTTFEGNILLCEILPDSKEELFSIVLNQTLFFPESGGQSPDIGYIGSYEVIDVQEKSDIIYHTVRIGTASYPNIGDTLSCEINWSHRFSNMQQHTGEHIFSGIVHKLFGYDNVGFHLSDNSVTMDYNGKLSWDDALLIEQKANEAIISNIPVKAFYPGDYELENLEYRSKLDADAMSKIRIVSIEDIDICACCAPHVHSTGEIGILKLTGLMNYKDGVRLHILCGFRALKDYGLKQTILAEASNITSFPIEQVPEAIQGLKIKLEASKQELKDINQTLISLALEAIDSNTVNPVIFTEVSDDALLRAAVNTLVKDHLGFSYVFSGNDSFGYRYIIGTSKLDARDALSSLKKHFDIKGGGNTQMVQGQIKETKEKILSALSSLE